MRKWEKKGLSKQDINNEKMIKEWWWYFRPGGTRLCAAVPRDGQERQTGSVAPAQLPPAPGISSARSDLICPSPAIIVLLSLLSLHCFRNSDLCFVRLNNSGCELGRLMQGVKRNDQIKLLLITPRCQWILIEPRWFSTFKCSLSRGQQPGNDAAPLTKRIFNE